MYIEYELFTSKSSQVSDSLARTKIDLLIAHEYFTRAEKEIERLKQNITDQHYIAKQKSLLCLVTHRFDDSYYYASKILHTRNDSVTKLLYALSGVKTGRFEEIRHYLLQEFPEDSTLINTMNTEIIHKSAKRASTLSAFVPGSGQIYSKHIFKGIVSTVLIGSCLYAGYYNYTYHYFVSASACGMYPAFRFWKGGISNSYHLAENFNNEQQQKIQDEFIAYIFTKYAPLNYKL